MRALGEVIVGLGGDFRGGVWCESVGFGSGAGRESFGVELGCGIVADLDAGLVLGVG